MRACILPSEGNTSAPYDLIKAERIPLGLDRADAGGELPLRSGASPETQSQSPPSTDCDNCSKPVH